MYCTDGLRYLRALYLLSIILLYVFKRDPLEPLLWKYVCQLDIFTVFFCKYINDNSPNRDALGRIQFIMYGLRVCAKLIVAKWTTVMTGSIIKMF